MARAPAPPRPAPALLPGSEPLRESGAAWILGGAALGFALGLLLGALVPY